MKKEGLIKYIILIIIIVLVVLSTIFVNRLEKKVEEKGKVLDLSNKTVNNLYEDIRNCNQSENFSINNPESRNNYLLKQKELKVEDMPNFEKFLCTITRIPREEYTYFKKGEYGYTEFKINISKDKVKELALNLFKTYDNENFDKKALISKSYYTSFYIKTLDNQYEIASRPEGGVGGIRPAFLDYYTKFIKAVLKDDKLYIEEKYIVFDQKFKEVGDGIDTNILLVKVYDSYLEDKKLLKEFEFNYQKDEALVNNPKFVNDLLEKGKTITYEFVKKNDKYVFNRSFIK